MELSKFMHKDILASLEDAGIVDVFFYGEKLQVINEYDVDAVHDIVGGTGVTIELVDS